MDDLELGYLLAVTAACVWSPRPLTTWFEALGNARELARYARSNPIGPPPGAEALSADAFDRLRGVDDDAARLAVAQVRESGCAVVLSNDERYPARLRDLRDPPFVLYCRGEISILSGRAVAIVGSRAASSYGRAQAANMAAEFAALGATIVSGFARGVDAAAHRGALDAGGLTAAIPGSGLRALYPDYHAKLADQIIERGGLLLSEFPPNMSARSHHFPMRNRIVAAVADATVVIEANTRSGALITARLADELGRHVFALPGDVDRPTSSGTNGLIKDGVGLVTSAADIAALLGWDSYETPVSKPTDGADPLLDLLRAGLDDPDELSSRTGETVGEVLARLTVLEIRGSVERRPGGKFAAVKPSTRAN